MRYRIIPVFLAVCLLLCQKNPSSPSDNPITKSDIIGYWAEYKCIITNDYYTSPDTQVTGSYTNNYASNISSIIYFDTAYLQSYTCLNNCSCYRKETAKSYTLINGALTAPLFTGIDIRGTDTIPYTSFARKENGELIITITFLGKRFGKLYRIDNEFHYASVNPFPPSYWTATQCP